MDDVWRFGLWILHVSSGVVLGLWWVSHHYGKLVKQERVWTDEALADTERIAYELESTRKLNVELARERDQVKLELDRCQEAFRDITIHLNDMAYEIASVAPNAKGD
jgi:hypothetical protein